MGIREIIKDAIEGFQSGGTEEALSEGAEEAAEEATGKDL
jgi:hypothetical protein